MARTNRSGYRLRFTAWQLATVERLVERRIREATKDSAEYVSLVALLADLDSAWGWDQEEGPRNR